MVHLLTVSWILKLVNATNIKFNLAYTTVQLFVDDLFNIVYTEEYKYFQCSYREENILLRQIASFTSDVLFCVNTDSLVVYHWM